VDRTDAGAFAALMRAGADYLRGGGR
jgi:hypothetical protein